MEPTLQFLHLHLFSCPVSQADSLFKCNRQAWRSWALQLGTLPFFLLFLTLLVVLVAVLIVLINCMETDYPWSAAASPMSSWHAAHGYNQQLPMGNQGLPVGKH